MNAILDLGLFIVLLLCFFLSYSQIVTCSYTGKYFDRIFGRVVSVPYYYPLVRGSELELRIKINYFKWIRSGTESTQICEDIWVTN